MGISVVTLRQYIAFREEGLLEGVRSVCELGSQEVSCQGGEEVIQSLVEAFGQPPAETEVVRRVANLGSGRELYGLLGLRYSCIDTDGRFGALPLDLNYDAVPPEHCGQY